MRYPTNLLLVKMTGPRATKENKTCQHCIRLVNMPLALYKAIPTICEGSRVKEYVVPKGKASPVTFSGSHSITLSLWGWESIEWHTSGQLSIVRVQGKEGRLCNHRIYNSLVKIMSDIWGDSWGQDENHLKIAANVNPFKTEAIWGKCWKMYSGTSLLRIPLGLKTAVLNWVKLTEMPRIFSFTH
jgi:hypothetical protein